MDIQKLKNNLKQRKAKRDKIKNKKPYKGDEESDSALDILLQAELNAVQSEIKHLERKILKYEE